MDKSIREYEEDVERYKGLRDEARRKRAWGDVAFYNAKVNDSRNAIKRLRDVRREM